MGGGISVESTLGTGSCFTFTLPLSYNSNLSNLEAKYETTPCNWDGPSLQILLVEDIQSNITFATALLKKLGHKVTVAENGKGCLELLTQSTFDLVLMDIQMPEMNGEEALCEIRKKELESGLHLPVIALTAYTMRGDKERFLAEGFDGYVSKPLIINDLLGEMKRVL